MNEQLLSIVARLASLSEGLAHGSSAAEAAVAALAEEAARTIKEMGSTS